MMAFFTRSKRDVSMQNRSQLDQLGLFDAGTGTSLLQNGQVLLLESLRKGTVTQRILDKGSITEEQTLTRSRCIRSDTSGCTAAA